MTSSALKKRYRDVLASGRPEVAFVWLTAPPGLILKAPAVGGRCQGFFEDATGCGRVLRIAVRDLAAESESQRTFTCRILRATLENAFRLSKRFFTRRGVDNVGKRLVQSL